MASLGRYGDAAHITHRDTDVLPIMVDYKSCGQLPWMSILKDQGLVVILKVNHKAKADSHYLGYQN